MMKKKLFIFTLIFSVIIALNSLVFATDIVMNLNNSNSATQTNAGNTSTASGNTADSSSNTVTSTDNSVVDDTVYSSSSSSTSSTPDEPSVTTTSSYEDSGELSITDMINIILIVVGVVLILLGIAIIIKLKK